MVNNALICFNFTKLTKAVTECDLIPQPALYKKKLTIKQTFSKFKGR